MNITLHIVVLKQFYIFKQMYVLLLGLGMYWYATVSSVTPLLLYSSVRCTCNYAP